MLPEQLALVLARREPLLWINPNWLPLRQAHRGCDVELRHVQEAELRLSKFAPLLATLFPELAPTGGLIDSPVYAGEDLNALLGGFESSATFLVKGDHALPVVGSIKARGGFYEVLLHADELAQRHGLLARDQDKSTLASPEARQLFRQHRIVVGSTGNLGLSIGTIATALGFRATVHMSTDAKEWKKARLRALGVEVVEHADDYGAAVAAGREQAKRDPGSYFVDDEDSRALFLGYAVGAIRLHEQLQRLGIQIGRERPLFAYLPCGVGGAPGGITFGLRHIFGDHAHCFFAEPVASPSMLVRLASIDNKPMSVQAANLDNRTEADGLAVARASEFAHRTIRPLVSGVFTVEDADLIEDLYLLGSRAQLRLEPSAAAGVRGPRWLLASEAGRQYVDSHDLAAHLPHAVHIVWTTGGALVPAAEYREFMKGGALSPRRKP
jgi:D-serine dehydratase